MESENVKFTDAGTFVTEHLKKLTSVEAMASFQYREGLIMLDYINDVQKLLAVTGVTEISRMILTLRDKRDVTSTLRSGEPIRMVIMSNGLLIALRRPRIELTDKEKEKMDDLYDLLNILI